MSLRWTPIIATVWLVSLVGVGLWAQDRRPRVYPPGAEPGQVLTGSDVGVRISPVRGPRGEVQGTLVVRVDGQWVEVTAAPQLRYAASPRSSRPAPDLEPPYTGATKPPQADIFASRVFDVTIGDETVALTGAEVTAGFFKTAKAAPLLGRFFNDAERASSAGVVVISHDLWTRAFDAAPEVI